jgi:hypothetical protein
MALGQLSHGGDLVIGSLYRTRATVAKQLWLDPDGEELSIQPTLLCPHPVQLTIRKSETQISAFIEQALRSVSVHIDDDCLPVDRKYPGL